MGQRRQLRIPAASCRIQGGGGWGWGEHNAWKRISKFQINQQQDYLWKKAIWLRVSRAEGRGPQEASVLLEKASISLPLPPWRREASGRAIKRIIVRTSRQQKVEGGNKSWMVSSASNWRLGSKKDLVTNHSSPVPLEPDSFRSFPAVNKIGVGGAYLEASHSSLQRAIFSSTLSLKRIIVGGLWGHELTAAQSLLMHITSPPAAPKVENESINEKPSGRFQRQIVPFPKPVSLIGKCSSTIVLKKRLKRGGTVEGFNNSWVINI